MKRLAANWQFLLISQIYRGKFFIRPEIALGLGQQVADLLNPNTAFNPTPRRLEIITQSDSGHRKAFFFEDDEEMDEQETGSPYDDAPEGSVAIIPIKGSMMKYGSWCEYGAKDLAAMMLEAATHKNISAIVLDLDSGGGAVDAVAPLVDAVRMVKSMGKPVVSSIDMACSACYWVASETDYLVADNNISAEVGSIGVMMSFYDAKEYYEKKGIKMHVVFSNQSANKNEAFMMALEGKYDMIKEDELDPLARSFQEAVKANRSGKLNTDIKGILNGKTFFAQEAKEYGLIDRVGSANTAIEVALALAHARKLS
jgi:signal peptide peptidase SppA